MMDEQTAAQLRAPFPEAAVGYKPTIWCKACRDSRDKCCGERDHQKGRCPKCKQWVTKAHNDLSFVGHAEVTDRLLSVDPFWFWEPLAYDQLGLPQRDADGGLWIKLTVCGVTRIGYGDAEGKKGPNAVKELVGDAVRVTAMRFGVGLDLWGASGTAQVAADLSAAHGDENTPPATEQAPGSAGSGNGQNGAQRPAQAPQQPDPAKAHHVAAKMLAADSPKRVEWWVGKVAEYGVMDVDVSSSVPAEARDTLGIAADEKITTDDLATYVGAYVGKHGVGPGASREPVGVASEA